MHVWLINPFDPVPGEALRAGRYAFLASILARGGHRVTWLTSSFSHTEKQNRGRSWDVRTPSPNLRIVLVPAPPYRANVGVKRIRNHLMYSRRVGDWASRQPFAPDLILASSPPVSSATGAVGLARRLGSRGVVDIQDLWPQFFAMLLPRSLRNVGALLLRPASRYLAGVYNRADGVVATCEALLREGLQGAVTHASPPALVVYLGIDLCLFDSCAGSTQDVSMSSSGRHLKAVYIGTLGAATDVSTLLNTAAMLSRPPTPVTIVVAGSGPLLPAMRAEATRLRLDNLSFAGFLPFQLMVRLLSECDVGLNPRVPGLPDGSYPNKVFDYMAAGLPIVNSVGGELADLVAAQGIGRQYRPGSAESLAEALVDLQGHPRLRRAMGRRARRLAEDRFDRNKSYQEYVGFLESIASGPRPSHAA